MTPEQRAEAAVRTILGLSSGQEERVRNVVIDAISVAIAEERLNCARLLEAIKDEYIDWCALRRRSSTDQMRFANMLSKASASIREGAHQR
jgi:hypothetical protein